MSSPALSVDVESELILLATDCVRSDASLATVFSPESLSVDTDAAIVADSNAEVLSVVLDVSVIEADVTDRSVDDEFCSELLTVEILSAVCGESIADDVSEVSRRLVEEEDTVPITETDSSD
jgi:hypothetical protein